VVHVALEDRLAPAPDAEVTVIRPDLARADSARTCDAARRGEGKGVADPLTNAAVLDVREQVDLAPVDRIAVAVCPLHVVIRGIQQIFIALEALAFAELTERRRVRHGGARLVATSTVVRILGELRLAPVLRVAVAILEARLALRDSASPRNALGLGVG
jgi:predicted GNAT family acetyltransferase